MITDKSELNSVRWIKFKKTSISSLQLCILLENMKKRIVPNIMENIPKPLIFIEIA